MTRDTASFVKRDEYIARLEVIIQECNKKIENKAAISTVKRFFSEVNRNMESISENLSQSMQEIKDIQTIKDSELSNLDKVINDL